MSFFQGLGNVVGSIGGSLSSALGGSSASDKAKKGAQQAMLMQMLQQRAVNKAYKPQIEMGNKAMTDYQAAIGSSPTIEGAIANLETDPGYLFEQQQGVNAIQGGASALGNLLSGATLKDLTEYGQGLAATRTGERFNQMLQGHQYGQNQLQNLINLGQAGLAAKFGTNYAGNVGQLLQDSANLSAAERMNRADAIGGALKGLSGGIGQAGGLGQFLGFSGGGSGGGMVGGALSSFGSGQNDGSLFSSLWK